MSVNVTGFDALLKDIKESPDRLQRATIAKAHKLAEQVAGQARQGAPVGEGRLRNSIHSFVKVNGDTVEGGAATGYAPAIYHEFGTGPVGDEHPHPMDGELGITRRPDGWKYQSAEVAVERGEEFVPYIKGVQAGKGGYVYTEGVPAKAFMYNALVANEDKIMEELGASVTEVFAK